MTDATGTVFDPSSQEVLTAENVSSRLLLTQAKLSAGTLLAEAGIDAKERQASDRLPKLHTRVRFSSPAPPQQNPGKWALPGFLEGNLVNQQRIPYNGCTNLAPIRGGTLLRPTYLSGGALVVRRCFRT